MKRQAGLTQLEFVAVAVVICLLIGAGLYYYASIAREVRRLSVELLANSFTTAAAGVRARWFIDGESPVALHRQQWHLRQLQEAQETEAADNPGSEPVWVYVNSDGWPLATEPVAPGQPQTPERCYQLWRALLDSPAPATVEGEQALGAHAYHISAVDGGNTCRYRLLDDDRYYMDYTPSIGKITVTGRSGGSD